MTLRQINQTLEEGLSLKLITQAYAEISAIKLKRIRTGIEANRQFFNEIAGLFRTLKQVALRHHQLEDIMKKLVTKNSRTIALLITSNYRFYGDINSMVINQFLLASPKFATDRIVLGKMGIEYLTAIKYQYPFTQTVFSSDLPTQAELKNLVETVKNYQQVLVFHSKFKTVLQQVPQVTDVTQTANVVLPPSEQVQTNLVFEEFKSFINPIQSQDGTEEPLDFILEPEIDKMLQFFDSQIITLLLETTFLEAELSRTASRMISMDEAQTNANKFILDQRKLLQSAKRNVANAALLDTFASFMQWRKHAQ